MKIYISYFYQIRFMSADVLPVSTAISDPYWFHHSRNQQKIYVDKNNVLNGFRFGPLVPRGSWTNKCSGVSKCDFNPQFCEYLKCYRQQLELLDFKSIIKRLENLANIYQSECGIQHEVSIALIVYESPANKCSEREVIKCWFANNGYELQEWSG